MRRYPKHPPHIHFMTALATAGERLIHFKGFIAGYHVEAGPEGINAGIRTYVMDDVEEEMTKLSEAIARYKLDVAGT